MKGSLTTRRKCCEMAEDASRSTAVGELALGHRREDASVVRWWSEDASVVRWFISDDSEMSFVLESSFDQYSSDDARARITEKYMIHYC